MRTAAVVALLALFTALLSAQPTASRASLLLPRPATVAEQGGAPLVLRSPVHIVVAPRADAASDAAELLARELRARFHLEAVVQRGGPAPAGAIRVDASYESANDESYALTVSAGGAALHAASARAAVWGVQTLLQLVEPAPTDADARAPAAWRVAAVRIDDAPRFSWRGSLVDVGRHWLPVRDLERHLDLLSRFKLNVFHWHLTEDQGWRLEIKRYPRLTQVGAWRTERDGSHYGGYYTQAQARHIVAYAKARGITVVPEIEMPGHSSAALAAYPQLGCTGDKIDVANSWGVFADIYCAGKEETFTFLFNVLDEVMAIFPSPVIHIGGDEAPKDRWTSCAACQAVMQRERLKDEEALQSWFMGRIAAHVASKGRRVIGWDEVLDGPYIEGGLVQSWRDSSYTRKAVTRGHAVVASPNAFTYINQPASQVTLANVYQFDPVPPGFDATLSSRVLGGEVTLWSEHITSGANLELMALPRMLAFADVMWSAAPRDLRAFEQRMEAAALPALRREGYAVGPASAPLAVIAVRVDSATKRPVVRLPQLAEGVVVRATTDGRAPTADSPILASGAVLDAPHTMRVQPFWGRSPILEERSIAFARHAAVGAAITVSPAPDRRYPGTGAGTLTDGLLGSGEHGDGLWQGWWGGDVTLQADLGAAIRADSVGIRFLQNVRSWIVLPSRVDFEYSTDGAAWTPIGSARHDVPVSREGAIVHTFSIAVPRGVSPRFVRIVAHNSGLLPAGHPGAGRPSWLFADELIVR